MTGLEPQSELMHLPVLSAVQQLSELLALNASLDAVRAELEHPFCVTSTGVTELAQSYDRSTGVTIVAVAARAAELSRSVAALSAPNSDSERLC